MAISVRRPATTNAGDSIFRGVTLVFAALVVLIVAGFLAVLIFGSSTSIVDNGISFLTNYNWIINDETSTYTFGAWNFIYATIATSVFSLIIGGLISIGAAIFLSEYAPSWLRTPLSFTIELLAAVPSVIYGFWGVQALAVLLGQNVDQSLYKYLNFLPLFNTRNNAPPPLSGRDIFTASVVLSIMIIPTITSIAREVLRTVPNDQREGMMAMGATKWQTISRVVLPAAQRGIIGALILGFGRAVGETVAVAYLIGGSNAGQGPTPSVFNRSQTLAAQIANSYGENLDNPQVYSALLELGLVLFVITFCINLAAQLLVGRQQRSRGKVTKTDAQIPLWRKVVNQLVFPVIMLLLAYFLSIQVSLIVIVIWALFKGAGTYADRSAAQGRPIPGAIIFNPSTSYQFRKSIDIFMRGLLIAVVVIAVIPLASILILVISNGLPALVKPGFLVNDFVGHPVFGGGALGDRGIGHAILGTLILVALGSLIGVPMGLIAGIYLAEFGGGRFGAIVRFTADMLQGIPSIIVGLFAYTVIVAPGFFKDPAVTSPFNGIAGSLALAIMMIPIISRTTEEILRLVPGSLREAGLALGVPQWRVILSIILPAAVSGVATGVILGIARIAGETAPLLLTARGNTTFPGTLNQQVPSLTLFMFTNAGSSQPELVQASWGASLVLILLIFILIFSVRLLTRSRLGVAR